MNTQLPICTLELALISRVSSAVYAFFVLESSTSQLASVLVERVTTV